MGEKWYETEEDKFYNEAISTIRASVLQGASFAKASELVNVDDEALKEAILDDALKVLIAELHFIGKQSLRDIGKKIGVPEGRLNEAKSEMLKDIEASAIEAYKKESGKSGNA